MKKIILFALASILTLTACDVDTHAVHKTTYLESSEPVEGMEGCNRLVIKHALTVDSSYYEEIVYRCNNTITTTQPVKGSPQITLLENNTQVNLYTKEDADKMCMEKVKTMFQE